MSAAFVREGQPVPWEVSEIGSDREVSMRSWMVVLVVAACTGLASGPALAFTMGETLGAAAVQGTLAGTSAGGVAGTIGSVRAHVGSAVSNHNQALVSALGAPAPSAPRHVSSGSGATWMTAASGTVAKGGEGWATLTSGAGAGSGWVGAEAFGGGAGAQNAWPTAQDAWARGGILPN
jgi:hypothetical protein